MKVQEQAKYKERLIAMRQRLAHEVDLSEEALREDIVSPGESSSVPSHPADAAVEGVDKEVAIAQNEEQMLEEVEGALERVEAGTFGDCQDCGEPIGKERLEALPYAASCIRCAEKQELESRT